MTLVEGAGNGMLTLPAKPVAVPSIDWKIAVSPIPAECPAT